MQIDTQDGISTRTFDLEYDDLGFMTKARTQDTLTSPDLDREFNYEAVVTGGLDAGIVTRLGPDGILTTDTYDEAYRLERVERRIPSDDILMAADYDYYANGQPKTVTYGNGIVTTYTCDDAARLTKIATKNGTGKTASLLLSLIYSYDSRDLVTGIQETGSTVGPTEKWNLYEYDDRGRLIEEKRAWGPGLMTARQWLYFYDQGGNRTIKSEIIAERQIHYTYDINDVATYGSANNRLMLYATYNTSGQSSTLESTTYYYYNDQGNVTRVLTDKENTGPGERRFDSTSLVYATNGQAVRYVLGESWDESPPETCDDNHDVHYAREFWYDGARQRYLNRVLDLATLGQAPQVSYETWSDYDGDNVYGDFRLTGGQWTQLADYEPALARSFVPGDPVATAYYHQDMLGSTRMVTSSGQGVFHKQWYSAFGESGTSATMRYGFAGAHGYQQDPAGDAFPFMHVGARYYDPATGRFLQRDPIGINAGTNVYSYVGSRPTVAVDPEGLWGDIIDVIDLTEDPYNRSDGRSDKFKDGVDKARRKIRGAFLLGCTNPWSTWPFAVRLGFWILGWRDLLL